MPGPELRHLVSTGSIIDVLHELAAGGAPPGTAVVAEEQTAGRGTRGRGWHSPPGGLWLGILYRDIAAGALEVLSLRVGLAVAAAIEKAAPAVRLSIKWPNDLLLGDRKTGGVLCEARWQGAALGWVVAGVGINVANPLPPALQATAATLCSADPHLTPDVLVEPVTRALRQLDLSRSGFSPDELASFQARDWLRGRAVRDPVAGQARGIRGDGSLLVERADGSVVPVRAGQVLPG